MLAGVKGHEGNQVGGLPEEGMLPRSLLLGAQLPFPRRSCQVASRTRARLAVGTAAAARRAGRAEITRELKKITKSSGKVFPLV